MTSKKAPRWVMAGTLFIIFLFALVNILNAIGFLPVERISFGNEYGESCSTSYVANAYLLNIASIIFFAVVACVAIAKKWSRLVLVGALLMIAQDVVTVTDFARMLKADNMQDLRDFNSPGHVYTYAMIETVLYLTGCLLIFINSKVRKAIRGASIVFVILFTLLSFIFIFNTSVALPIARAIIALCLCVLCFLNANDRNNYAYSGYSDN